MQFSKQQREVAKREGLALIVLGVDGKHARRAGFEFTGPATKEEADLVWELFAKISKMRNKKKAPKE